MKELELTFDELYKITTALYAIIGTKELEIQDIKESMYSSENKENKEFIEISQLALECTNAQKDKYQDILNKRERYMYE